MNMKRTILRTGWIFGFLLIVPAARGQEPTPDDLKATAKYATDRQNADGSFSAEPGEAPSLGATSSAIRILKYVGGTVPDVPACAEYVKSCFDADSGGFAPTPGGTPDVRTTAIGLMAVKELKIDDAAMIERACQFMADRPEAFEDVRMAIAGFEAIERQSPRFRTWSARLLNSRNDDGTWGQGASQAFDTGGIGASILRMGADLDNKEAVAEAIRSAQKPEGGWSSGEGPPDLASSYRVMRALYMLGEPPDVESLRQFIASCRKPDGGYATTPEGDSSISGTYFAAIMLYWLAELEGEEKKPESPETAGFRPMFNGRDFEGWEGDTTYWSVEDGVLVGKSPGIKYNTFLATEERFHNFVFRCSFQLVDGEGNSGIQFRSERQMQHDQIVEEGNLRTEFFAGHEMIGYQADIAEGLWGCLYDESRRRQVLAGLAGPHNEEVKGLDKTGWNTYVIKAVDDRIVLQINGVTTVDYREPDPEIAAKDGKIAVQIHSGGPMEVRFRDIVIKPLPSTRTDAKGGQSPEAEGSRQKAPLPSPEDDTECGNDDESGSTAALIERDRVGLNLGGARVILAASEAQAEQMGLKVNITIVDDGGHLIAFARMDGARPGSGYTSMTKAIAAATFRMPTGPIPPGTDEPDLLLNLALQHTSAAGGGKATVLYGGVPVVVDDQVIGAVGVGGATGEQDAEIARAGIAALLEQIGDR
ncbi:hypothetical protein BH23PLA1_BH23PLA1_08950 [soil metagenome]